MPMAKTTSHVLRDCKLLVLIIGAAAFTAGAAGQGPPPATVRVDVAKMEAVQERRMVTGELRAIRRALVATEEPGIVLEVAFEEGQLIKQGQRLATLDSKRLELELRDIEAQEQSAIAALQERRAELDWRRRDLETYQSLSQRSATNPKELYDAEAQVAIAQAKHAGAETAIRAIRAQSALLQQRLADMTISAPFDGVVVAKHIEIGEWVDEGNQVAEIVSTGTLDAWVDVPQQFADAVFAKSPEITVVIDALGQSVEAVSVRAIPLVSSTARSFSMIARIENKQNTLAPGMSVTAWVPTGDQQQALTIPKDAVLRNEVGPFVYVAKAGATPDAPATATPIAVQTLFAEKDRFVVRAPGIQPGDMLVVEGNERLFPMAPVIPIPVNHAGQSATLPQSR